jgi:hypothetical protein
MRFPPSKSPLTSKEQAFDLGRRASETRISRGAKPADLEFNIEVENLHYELSPFYDDWKRGFRQGLRSANRGPIRGNNDGASSQIQ